MRTLRRFFKRLTSWARTKRDEERLQEEIAEHLALATEENLRARMSPIEARRQAMLKFGGVEAMKEEYRDQKGLPFLETLAQRRCSRLELRAYVVNECLFWSTFPILLYFS